MENEKITISKDEYDEIKKCENAYFRIINFIEDNLDLDSDKEPMLGYIFKDTLKNLKYVMADGDYEAMIERFKARQEDK